MDMLVYLYRISPSAVPSHPKKIKKNAMIELISSLVIPAVLLAAGILMFRHGEYFNAFIKGAADGLKCTVDLIPTMVLLISALYMFTKGGAAELLTSLFTPLCKLLGLPAELVPLAITRPVSGSAATATFASMLETYGADSYASVTAAIMMGSSDTLVYVIAVYFSKTRVKKTLRVFAIAAVGSLLCLFLSSILARIFF